MRKATLGLVTVRVEGSHYAGSTFYRILIKGNVASDNQLLHKIEKKKTAEDLRDFPP